ncbi:MAG: transcription antitermination factor NusB [Acidobacteriota bacterium]
MSKRRLPPTLPARGRSRRQTPRRRSEDNVRVAAGWVLDRTLDSLAPVDSFLTTALERFDDRDQALLCQLVLGSLRWLRRIDAAVAAASHRSFADIEPVLHAPLRIAAYQILFLDRIPAHAAVNEAVDQARHLTHRGGASFVNAVLRRLARDPELDAWPVEEADPVRRLAIELSHPEFLVRRWYERFGAAATRRLLAANNRPKPLQLVAFCDRGGRELLAESLLDEGLEVEPTSLSPLGLTVLRGDPLVSEAFRRGDFYVQDEGSQVAALIPPPEPGERILDAAAAPGGKSFALLAQEPSVELFLADRSLPRTVLLAHNLERLGRRLPVTLADAARSPFGSDFDRVVLDLPCSGTGTLRKHPELKWRVSEEEVGRLSEQAFGMLRGVADRVRRKGLLVAITCSLEAEENERVVERFLNHRRDFQRLDLESEMPDLLGGEISEEGTWRLLPAGDHDGFSVTVLRRSSVSGG